MVMTPPDRNQARAFFYASGLTYDVLTRSNLQRLRAHINRHMKLSGFMRGTYRCKQRATIKKNRAGLIYAQVRCKAYYFDDREAVSFNTDGFIGFAGWADDNNIKPVLAGFVDWIDSVVRDIAELPDRYSPEDFPDALVVTADELRCIIERHNSNAALEGHGE